MKKKIVLFPLALFLVYFVAEKSCLLPRMKELTQGDATYLYFDYKAELLDQLEETYKKIQATPAPGVKKKILIVLGSSRMLYFNYPQFARSYPEWELFNFSAPVTAPAYYAFILERILDRGIVPDFVLLETDPFQYNEGSNAFVRSNLAFSFDFRFVLQHFRLFTNEEISYFFARNLFAGFKYPPDLQSINSRLKNDNDRFLIAFRTLDEYQRKNRGSGLSIIPRENWYERDFPKIEGTSLMTMRWLYGNYKISDRQFEFLKMMMKNAQEKRIRMLLIRPPVSRPMEKLLSQDADLGPKLIKWDERLKTVMQPYDSAYMDLRDRPDFYCNTFVDGSHMALDCYPPMLVLVMRHYWGL